MVMDDAQPAVGHRLVVVEGHSPGRADRGNSADRGPTRNQLSEAGRLAATGALPLLGALLLAIWPLGGWSLLQQGVVLAAGWCALTLPMALGMLWLPRKPSRRQIRHSARWGAVVGLSTLVVLLLPWLAPAPLRPVMALLAMAWSLVAAGALAPWRPLGFALVTVPLLAAIGAAYDLQTAQRGLWLAAGLVCSFGVWGSVQLRHKAWRRNARRLLTMEAQLLALEAERDQARRNEMEKSRFVAIASHDLRQPVHALGLFAATLQKRLLNTPHEALVRNFLRAVDDLEHSFSSMLDVSRLDAGSTAPLLQTFALRDLFRRLQMQYAGHAELAGLGLRFSTGGKSVTSDPQLLERLVGNLVQNALKYTTRGGVVVVARSTRSHVNIEVWDTGPGILAQDLPRVFQEFYQLAPGKRGRSHGMGMGLAIVKRLAQLLGHRLEVSSLPGRGSLFRVGVAIEQTGDALEAVAPEDTRPMTVDTPQMVLIVEDEEAIREGLRGLLQEWGYQTVTAADAEEAEQAVMALEGKVDLVLSDVQLSHIPGQVGGLTVIDTVRRIVGFSVPALIVTGDTSPALLKALAERGDPVLFKPVQPRRLFDAMRSVLG